jgi:hypothetical protein
MLGFRPHRVVVNTIGTVHVACCNGVIDSLTVNGRSCTGPATWPILRPRCETGINMLSLSDKSGQPLAGQIVAGIKAAGRNTSLCGRFLQRMSQILALRRHSEIAGGLPLSVEERSCSGHHSNG